MLSELTLTVMRLGLLVLMWFFVFAVVGVLRGDLYGTRVKRRASGSAARPPRAEPPGTARSRAPRAARPPAAARARPSSRSPPARWPARPCPLRPAGTLIGRSPECALVLDDDYASRPARAHLPGRRRHVEGRGPRAPPTAPSSARRASPSHARWRSAACCGSARPSWSCRGNGCPSRSTTPPAPTWAWSGPTTRTPGTPVPTCSPWPTAWAATPAATSRAPRSSARWSGSTARRSAAATPATPCSTASTAANAEIGDAGARRPRASTAWAPRSSPCCGPATRSSLAHIGDSRAFLVRDGVVTQITKDHSFVQNLVDEGRITADEAADPPAALPRDPGAHRRARRRARPRRAPGPDRRPLRHLLRRPHRLRRARHHRRGPHDHRRPRRDAPTGWSPWRCGPAPPTTSPSSSATSSTSTAHGPPTQPQVVGAAAARQTGTRPIPTTPAAKAAALTAQATGGADPDDERHPRRGGPAVRGAAPSCAWPPRSSCSSSSSPAARTPRTRGPSASTTSPRTTAWSPCSAGSSRTSARCRCPSPEYSTTIAVDDLPSSYQDSLQQGIEVDDRAAADARVAGLRLQAQACRWAQLHGEACRTVPLDVDHPVAHAARRPTPTPAHPRHRRRPRPTRGDLVGVTEPRRRPAHR